MNSISCVAANPQKTGRLLSEPRYLACDDLGVTQQLYAKLQGMRETGCVKSSPSITLRLSMD